MPYGFPRRLIIGTGTDARVYRVAGEGSRTPRWKSEPVPSQEGDPLKERRIPLGDGSAGIIGSHRHFGKPAREGVADVTNGDTSVEDRYGAGPLVTTVNLSDGDFYSAGTIGSSLTIGGGTMTDAAWTVIGVETLGSAAASISFASGLTGYTMFRVTAYIVKDGTNGEVLVRLNNDSTGVYENQRLLGNGATVSGARESSATSLRAQAAVTASANSTLNITIAKPLATVAAMAVWEQVLIASSAITSVNLAGQWNNTSDLISRIDLLSATANFAAGTVVVLEGV